MLVATHIVLVIALTPEPKVGVHGPLGEYVTTWLLLHPATVSSDLTLGPKGPAPKSEYTGQVTVVPPTVATPVIRYWDKGSTPPSNTVRQFWATLGGV